MTSILIVDDNDLDVERVERGLRRLDINLATVRARDGLEALTKLTASDDPVRRPVMVLLDINMPRMNGLEFLRELRADPTVNDIPVFVLTTSSRPQDVAAAHACNVNGYVVKPHAREAFLDVLATLASFWTMCEYPTTGPDIGGNYDR